MFKKNLPLSLRDVDLPTFLDSPHVAQFLGPYYEYYKNLWLSDLEKKGSLLKASSSMHWNLLGFFFLFSWFGYHKMYGLAISLASLIYASFFIEAIFDFELGSTGFSSGLVVLSFLSKGLYVRHVLDFFYKHRDDTPEELERQIQKKGGVSVLHAFLCFGLVIVGCFVSLYLSDIMFGHPGSL